MSKRAVVTGASGHLGFHVAQAALQAGFEVELLIRRRNTNIDRLLSAGAHFSVVDFADRTTFRGQLQWADVLFQVAAANTTDTSNSLSVLAGTSGLAEQILNAAIAAGVPRIVYTSSVVVLGRSLDPHRLITEQDRTAAIESPYVQGKVLAEQFCDRLILDHGVDLRRVYPSWLVGPGDPRGTPPQRLIRDYLKKGQRFWFTGGISIASVEEVGRAHTAAALSGERCGSYVLGGENITFQEFYRHLASLSGRPAPQVQLPKALLVAGSRALAAACKVAGRRSPLDPAYVRSVVGSYSWYDSSKAIRDLGYKILPVEDILKSGILMERKRAAGTNALFAKPASRRSPAYGSTQPNLGPILLTGLPGWLGNRFIDILLNGDRTGFRYPDREIRLLVHPRHQELFDLPGNFRIFPADLSRRQDLSKVLTGVQTVVHLAGVIYPPRIDELYQVNTQGTKYLVDECIRANVRRFLYMSTDSVCGFARNGQRLFDENTRPTPYRNYGRSKWLAEEYVLEKTRAGALDGTILRGFWFFGPFAPARQEQFFAMMGRRHQWVFGTGKNFRSISHIDNTVAAFLAAERSSESIGKAYWIGDEKADYTVDEIYQLLCGAKGQAYRPIYIPSFACSAARAADTVLGKFGLLHPTIHALGKFDFDIAGRIDAAQRDFGYRPVISLAEYASELGKRGSISLASKKASAS